MKNLTAKKSDNQSTGVHRFMLNLRRDLYERVRESSHEDRSSMSAMINDILAAYYLIKDGGSDETK